jgi:two-component system, OmpR family, sensor histidine kinase TctE
MSTKNSSLKSGFILRLIIPLIFFMTVEAVLSYFITLHYVDTAYDRWLLDSARSLVQEIKVKNNKVSVELPTSALEMFKWDESDKTYFKIISAEQGVIAGDVFVPESFDPNADWSQPIFFNDSIYNESVRVVSMLIQRKDIKGKVFVHVAETLNKRRTMMRDILLADLLPQSILVLFTGLYLVTGVKRGLKPLHKLASEIAQRSPRDLSPIAETYIFPEVRTLTDTINDLLARLTTAIAAQQRFIANAAHQLRTPLAGLKLQAERALREDDLTAMRPALLQIQSSADRASHLITQLLLLAKAEPVEGMHKLQSVNLSDLAKEVCMDWISKALQRKMTVSFDSENEQVFLQGDEILLKELLANLLDNAIAYGYERGNIGVKVIVQPHKALIVEDDGIGIAEAELDKVFERFYRPANSPGNGCGLGLAIIKEIADLHHAQINLNRLNEDGGLRVEIIFSDS